MIINYKIKKLKVRWRRFIRRFDKGLYPHKEYRISPYQEKGIRLWKLMLKDQNSKLGVNTYGVRQIEKENLLLVFNSIGNSNDDSVLTIMDVNESGNNVYELHLGNRQAISICNKFDIEMDRRMYRAESAKRLLIESDLDRLLILQENKKL